jgi:hypothetical protein
MRIRNRAGAAALAALALVAACDSASGPPKPRAGEVTVRLETPHDDDGALVLSLTGPGPIGAVTAAAAGVVVDARPDGQGVRAAVFGRLEDGDLVRVAVPDVHRAGEYRVRAVQAAGRDNHLRQTVSGYRLTVRR